jgi:predicted peroxiredoxin
MSRYLLIETRDPFDSADAEDLYELAGGLADTADDVAVYLVQNGVLPTRRASSAAPRIAALAARARVMADDFSLRERAIRTDELVDGVTVANVDMLVDLITEDGRKVLWH